MWYKFMFFLFIVALIFTGIYANIYSTICGIVATVCLYGVFILMIINDFKEYKTIHKNIE